MSNYNTRSRLYIVDYKLKGEEDKIGPTPRRMKENNKNEEGTEIPGIAAHCARSHSLWTFLAMTFNKEPLVSLEPIDHYLVIFVLDVRNCRYKDRARAPAMAI